MGPPNPDNAFNIAYSILVIHNNGIPGLWLNFSFDVFLLVGLGGS